MEGLLRQLGPAELNAKGKALCGQFRALMAKYPFNPAAQTAGKLQEVNAVFRKPEGGLWTLYDGSLQKLLPKQGNQYVAAGQPGMNLNPAFVGFFNRAAAFAEAAYAPRGRPEPRIGYTLEAGAHGGAARHQPAYRRPDHHLCGRRAAAQAVRSGRAPARTRPWLR